MENSNRKKSPTQSITSSADFIRALKELRRLLKAEQSGGLRVGEIADKWLGDAGYRRELNAELVAQRSTPCVGDTKQDQNL